MNLKTIALIAVAVWTPLLTDADAAQKLKRDIQRPAAAKCLSQSQILAKLRRQGYRATARDMQRSRSAYIVTAVRHSGKVSVKVDRCTGRVLSVQAAREAARQTPNIERLRKAPRIQIACLSKEAIHQKLKAKGYNYLKLENIHGPFNTPKGKVYRAQTLVKEGPRWCQAKLTANCHTAQITDYDTQEDTCIY